MTSSNPPFYLQQGLDRHFQALEQLLLELQPLWQAQPFKQVRPDWCQDYPELTEALLSLSDMQLAELRSDDSSLYTWLSDFIPVFSKLATLLQVEAFDVVDKENWKHLDWAVPGRKWQQITAFSSVLPDTARPTLEWCGGKGHLGRILASKTQQLVTTLEQDQSLCEAGKQLSKRAGVKQIFHQLDVFSAHTPNLRQHHVVALHACGELHRHLVRKAVAEQSPALDIAPCCYHLYGQQNYIPFTESSALLLSKDDLRIAVTETVTSKRREVTLRDREMAWKLGFMALIDNLSGDHSYRAIAPIEKRWLNATFEAFCWRLAERDGLAGFLHADICWSDAEAYGWMRQAEVMRLSLLRHGVRRILELWLVLDMALYLQANSYKIRLGTFCSRQLTPRNIMLSARLDD